MNKAVALFFDRLSERFAALLAGVLSARIEGMHAAAQADQQSQLEDLARNYDADGKPEIAAVLRQRAMRLGSSELAGEAVDIVRHLTDETAQTVSATGEGTTDLRGLPDFSVAPRPTRAKRTKRMKTATEDTGLTGTEFQP